MAYLHLGQLRRRQRSADLIELHYTPMHRKSLHCILHTYSPITTGIIQLAWYRLNSGDARGWEGNRRSGVALAMRHRLQQLIKA